MLTREEFVFDIHTNAENRAGSYEDGIARQIRELTQAEEEQNIYNI